MFAAIYVRVSSRTQDHKSQLPDLERWVSSQNAMREQGAEPLDVRWFTDTFTGKTMDRPGWNELDEAIRSGQVSQIVVWRLDRLGRTTSGVTALFDELRARKINLVSIKDGLDLSTPAGRLMANVLASVAQYDNEIRAERVLAGQAVARARGIKWGGSKPGVHKKVTKTQIRMIRRLNAEGDPKTEIAKATGLSRPTIYAVLANCPS